MRAKRKKLLYVMFLLISILMFLQGWESFNKPIGKVHSFAKKHNKHHPHKKTHFPFYQYFHYGGWSGHA